MTKSEARNAVKELRAKLTDEAVFQKSEAVISGLEALDEFALSDNILVYVSYNKEVDTKKFINDCLNLGKRVFVPKVYGKEMKFHNITSLDELSSGNFGIYEPVNDYLEEWDNIEGLMIMPGLAFDKELNRVGYGGGYYDKYLAAHTNVRTAAICFDFQLVDNIEAEEHDLKPDILISETNIFKR